MFTGIIEELGTIKNITRRRGIALFQIKAERVLEDARIGDSISVNGVCLTVIEKERDHLGFEAMEETIRSTSLGYSRVCDRVNLERALKLGQRLSGHFVTGHVDCIGLVRRKIHIAGSVSFGIAVVAVGMMKYVFPKGSVAVDGISLTVAEKRADLFTVNIIPHTLANTTLGFKGPSQKVNIEFDILAKNANVG